MKKVNLVFGTVYGSAQFVTETLFSALLELGYQAQIIAPDALHSFVPPQEELLILVSSTTGQGDLPDDIFPWFLQMQNAAPYLPKLKYAVIGLGDSSYETFCGAAKQLDALMQELGATAVVERLEIDACETMEPEVEALTWLQRWHSSITSEPVA